MFTTLDMTRAWPTLVPITLHRLRQTIGGPLADPLALSIDYNALWQDLAQLLPTHLAYDYPELFGPSAPVSLGAPVAAYQGPQLTDVVMLLEADVNLNQLKAREATLIGLPAYGGPGVAGSLCRLMAYYGRKQSRDTEALFRALKLHEYARELV